MHSVLYLYFKGEFRHKCSGRRDQENQHEKKRGEGGNHPSPRVREGGWGLGCCFYFNVELLESGYTFFE